MQTDTAKTTRPDKQERTRSITNKQIVKYKNIFRKISAKKEKEKHITNTIGTIEVISTIQGSTRGKAK